MEPIRQEITLGRAVQSSGLRRRHWLGRGYSASNPERDFELGNLLRSCLVR
jgi:hypothetical protein